MWHLFGLRGWHPQDLDEVDADVFDQMVDAAKRYEADMKRQQRE